MPIGSAPPFSEEKFIERLLKQGDIKSNFEKYAIGLTDVSKEYIEWKYNSQGKTVYCFDSAPTTLRAEKVYTKLQELPFKNLGYDSLKPMDLSNCKNIFIVRHPQDI